QDLVDEEVFQKVIRPHYEAVLEGQKVVYDATVPYKDGPRYVHVTYSPGFDQKGMVQSIFISLVDMTEQKKIQKTLEDETVLRDKFVSTLSHDLRTPLTAAKMSAQVINRRVTEET